MVANIFIQLVSHYLRGNSWTVSDIAMATGQEEEKRWILTKHLTLYHILSKVKGTE